MSCCKCNRSGRCRNCSCVKSGRTCQGCHPQRLGNCANGRQSSSQPASSDSNQPPNLNPQVDHVNVLPETPTEVPISPAARCHDSTAGLGVLAWPYPALQLPNFTWGSCSGETFGARINTAYEEVIHWKWNLVQEPLGELLSQN